MRKKIKRFAYGCLCTWISASAFLIQEDEIFAREYRIPEGVTIGHIAVGGKTPEEAKQEIQAFVDGRMGTSVRVAMDANTVELTAGELGYFWENTTVTEEAGKHCRFGNVIARYKEACDIKKDGISYNIDLKLNQETLQNTITEKCGIFNIPHVNASLTKTGSGFEISKESSGRMIDMETSMKQLEEYLLNGWDGAACDFALTVVDDMPVSTVADCEQVTDLLGSYTTTFSTGASNYNRNWNMQHGTTKLNGITLSPGEIFSVNAVLEPWTPENGWKSAGAYLNGQVVNDWGGGICQVSTTLYVALLNAEVHIEERFAHSMSVDYVPLSMDAALAGTWKDLKFKNTFDIPIYVEGIYDASGKIIFNIYGKETRPANRRVEYVSETLSTTPAQEVITEDPGKPAGYRYVTSYGHTGARAQLLKRVYVDGSLTSEEVVNKSSYNASKTYVTVGTGAGEIVTEAPSGEEPATDAPSGEEPVTEAPSGEEPQAPSQEELPQEETTKQAQEEETTKKKPDRDDKDTDKDKQETTKKKQDKEESTKKPEESPAENAED